LTEPRTPTALPVLNQARPDSVLLPRLVHGLRVLLLVAILVVVRYANQKSADAIYDLSSDPTAVAFARSAFETDGEIQIRPSTTAGRWEVVAESSKGTQVGDLIRTSPQSDDITGFSGPTDCLVALGANQQIVSVGIFNSRDTVEHVDLIQESPDFFASFSSRGGDAQSWSEIDAVSGATLTSYAIIASVAKRLGGLEPALKFAAEPKIEKVRLLFPKANVVEGETGGLWQVKNGQGRVLGQVLTTTPAADNLVGYQGPTAVLLGFKKETCVGLAVDQTYDNQPYASYLDDDYGFQKKYKGKTLTELSAMNPQQLGIEGISGATMTSMAIAEGIPLATTAALRKIAPRAAGAGQKPLLAKTRDWGSYGADFITIGLVLIGVVFSFTKLSKRRWLRIGYQIAVVVVLGFYSGHMLSQASVAGWAANTLPWQVAPGLVFLSLAAIAVPMFSKHQPYCQHICPFGAMQQWARTPLVKRIIRWNVAIDARLAKLLRCLPIVLLATVIVTATSGSVFNLASIEPFDGFGLRVAGWATIAIFVVGLLLSFVSPMAYCRFGCPTGVMLGYLRFRGDSHRLGLRDFVAVCLLLLALYVLTK
jgi:Na+-translocating ferredoxin:NAD+ oxidoreductase RnfG subunit